MFETVANEQEQFNQKINEEVPCIRKADLENHNKDGGLWIVIHGKVYDVEEFKTQAACGRALLEQYSGQFNLSCILVKNRARSGFQSTIELIIFE